MEEELPKGVCMSVLQEVANRQVKFPIDQSTVLFQPTKSPLDKGEVKLTGDEIVKGVAAGMAQSLLENALHEALRLYPPPAWE